jgi:hypothetical protein
MLLATGKVKPIRQITSRTVTEYIFVYFSIFEINYNITDKVGFEGTQHKRKARNWPSNLLKITKKSSLIKMMTFSRRST